MRTFIWSAVALTAVTFSGPVLAADLPMKALPPPAPTWTGCYVDGGGGYGWWNQDHFLTSPIGTTVTTTDGGRGWLGRVGGGCDYQVAPRWVIGALGDFDFMNLQGSNSPSEIFPAAGPGITPITANVSEQSAWNVGARVGYLLTPSIMTYISGGYTEARFVQSGEFQTLGGAAIGFGYPNFTAQGWFLGGGTETAVSDWLPGLPAGLFLRTDYRFAEYQTRNLSEANLTTGALTGNVEHVSPFVQTITTSLVWRFNWTALPLATKY